MKNLIYRLIFATTLPFYMSHYMRRLTLYLTNLRELSLTATLSVCKVWLMEKLNTEPRFFRVPWLVRTEDGRLILSIFTGVACVLWGAALIVLLCGGWNAAAPGFIIGAVFALLPWLGSVATIIFSPVGRWIERGE